MRIVLFFLLSLFFVNLSLAQDTIFFKNQNVQIVNVVEINKCNVLYKKSNNLSGPIYRVESGEIDSIIFTNRTVEIFKNFSSQNCNLLKGDKLLNPGSNIIAFDFATILFKKINLSYERVLNNNSIAILANVYLPLGKTFSFQNGQTGGLINERIGGGLALKYYPLSVNIISIYCSFNTDLLRNTYKYVDYINYQKNYNQYLVDLQAGNIDVNDKPVASEFYQEGFGKTIKATINLGFYTSGLNRIYACFEGGAGYVQNFLPTEYGIVNFYEDRDRLEQPFLLIRVGAKLGYRF